MNANGAIDAADLVTATAYSFGTQSGVNVAITATTRSQGNDSAVIAVQKQSLDGLQSWSTDAAGLTTHTQSERLGSGNTRQTVTYPDGRKTVTNSTNGRVTTVQQINSDNTDGNLTTYTYDEFNRVSSVVETDGQTTVNTIAYTYDAAGQTLTQTVNGQVTSYEYDAMGRQTKVTAPGGVETDYEYYPTGALKKVSDAEYPVEYTYDAQGRRTLSIAASQCHFMTMGST